jgi:type II secretory pathway component PulF
MSELFAGFGNELPTVTQIVVALSHWLSGNIGGLRLWLLAAQSSFICGRVRQAAG